MIVGFSVSKGMPFLLQVIPARPSAFSWHCPSRHWPQVDEHRVRVGAAVTMSSPPACPERPRRNRLSSPSPAPPAGAADDVLAGDQFDLGALAAKLLVDRAERSGVTAGERFGEEARVAVRGVHGRVLR